MKPSRDLNCDPWMIEKLSFNKFLYTITKTYSLEF